MVINAATFKLMIKYPWSSITANFLKEENISAADLLNREDLLERAKKELLAILDGKTDEIEDKEDFDNIYIYYLRIILATYLKSAFLARRLSVIEQKKAYKNLISEEEKTIAEIAKNTFNWHIEIGPFRINDLAFNFRIYFKNYLEGSKSINDKYWALSNRVLKEGFVFLNKREVARVISEMVKEKIFEKIMLTKTKKIPQKIKKVIEELEKKTKKREIESFEGITQEVKVQAFPPCMKYLLAKVKKGENLSHLARFAITSFLINVGFSVDEIVELWRSSPDFDENIARYQVEHIAGLRGSGTKYTPPSCKTLKVHGICPEDVECDEKVNPLRYYFMKIRRRRGKKNNVKQKH